MKKNLILTYHKIFRENDSVNQSLADQYSVSESDFENQIRAILERNIEIVSLENLFQGKVESEYSVTLTFDDGNASDYDIVFPILKKFNIPATFFISTGNLNNGKLEVEKLVELSENKLIEIGSHGLTHRDLRTLKDDEIRKELLISREYLQKIIQKPVDFFALPYGSGDSRIYKLCSECGYKAVFTTRKQINPVKKGGFLFNRWTIKAGTSTESFGYLLNPDSFSHKSMQLFYMILNPLRKWIGISGEQRVLDTIRKLKYSRVKNKA
ncbi:MAG: polysaccharide deacetylase family protein [Bacteroidales bacterium]|nr:polysaccharide deacetylase family protein [Bacteroidales bacterium]